MTDEQLKLQQAIAEIVKNKDLESLQGNYKSWVDRKTANSKKTPEELSYWQNLASSAPVENELDKTEAHIFDSHLFSNSAEAKAAVYRCLMSVHGDKLTISDKSKPVLRELSLYFAGFPSKLDPAKGVFLFGPTGTGKSSLMRIFQRITNAYNYRYRRFLVNSIPWIYEETRNSQDFDLKEFTFYPRCFDDVGFNLPEVSRYGNKINPLDYILFERYNRYQRGGLLTHMTSNLPLDNLNEHLDKRIISRMKEMMNFVLLDGQDFRYIKK